MENRKYDPEKMFKFLAVIMVVCESPCGTMGVSYSTVCEKFELSKEKSIHALKECGFIEAESDKDLNGWSWVGPRAFLEGNPVKEFIDSMIKYNRRLKVLQ